MATAKLNYPLIMNQKNYHAFCLYPANTQLYYVVNSLQSQSTTGLPNNKYANFQLLTQKGSTYMDLSFTFNGIYYKNSNVLNAPNLFYKKSSLIYDDQVLKTLEETFKETGLLDDYTFTNAYTNSTVISGVTYYRVYFTLTAIEAGDNQTMTVSDSKFSKTNFADRTEYVYYPTGQIAQNEIYIYAYDKAIGSNVSEDVSNYEIDLDIYKEPLYLDSTGNIQTNKILQTSLTKKFNTAPFDLSTVLKNVITDWRPSISDFAIKVDKYIERFKISAYQKFIDKQTDPNNSYLRKYGFDHNSYLYAIDTTMQYFDGYNPDQYDKFSTSGLQTFTNKLAQINLELYNDSSSGIYQNENGLFEDFYYNKNLTNQPRTKRLNKSYEMLNNQVYTVANLQTYLKDSIEIKFYSGTNSLIETVILNTQEKMNGDSLRYINTFCFNVENLKYKMADSDNWSDVKYFEVRFKTLNYRTDRSPNIELENFSIPLVTMKPIDYEVQTYTIDSNDVGCDDNTIEEVDGYTTVVFKNRAGGFDIFDFDDISELSTDRDINTLNVPYTYKDSDISIFEKIYSMSFKENFTCYSRVLTNEEFVWLEECITSDEVYILKEGKLYPIIISEKSYGFKGKEDRVISFTFNFSRPKNF